MAPTSKPPVEEDVDDLDEYIDQFANPTTSTSTSTPPQPAPPPPPSTTTTSKPTPPSAPAPASASEPSAAATPPTFGPVPPPLPPFDDPSMDEAFQEELLKGMEELLAGFQAGGVIPPPPPIVPKAGGAADEGVGLGGEGAGEFDESAMREMQAEFERLFKSIDMSGINPHNFDQLPVPETGTSGTASASGSGARSAAQATTGSTGKPKSFKEQMDEIQGRLKSSNESATAQQASSSNDPLAPLLSMLGGSEGMEGLDPNLLSQLSALASKAGGEGGEGDEGGIQDMLDGMMQQLMSKDVLYDPLKDLRDKYPAYISENSSTIPPADLERYTRQHKVINRIVEIFEEPDYTDDVPNDGDSDSDGDDAAGKGKFVSVKEVKADDKKSRAKARKKEVVRLMEEMQECGNPPKDLVGDLEMPSEENCLIV